MQGEPLGSHAGPRIWLYILKTLAWEVWGVMKNIGCHYHFSANAAVTIGASMLALADAISSSISTYNLCIVHSNASWTLLAFEDPIFTVSPSR